jgi:hypothetical protein
MLCFIVLVDAPVPASNFLTTRTTRFLTDKMQSSNKFFLS